MILLQRESMVKATVTSKGQVTIPKKVRERLGLRPGDELEFIIEGDRVQIRPIHRYRAADLPGLLRGSRIPYAGADAEDEALARALAEKDRRWAEKTPEPTK